MMRISMRRSLRNNILGVFILRQCNHVDYRINPAPLQQQQHFLCNFLPHVSLRALAQNIHTQTAVLAELAVPAQSVTICQ